jgi:ankyrin repeat protein
MATPNTVVEMLNHDKVDVNLQNKAGLTAFCWASKDGRTDLAVEMLKHDKVDVNPPRQEGFDSILLGEPKWPHRHCCRKC